jgi:hypothetical protein
MLIAYLCDLGVVGECWRLRAEHSQLEMIAEFIDCGGNALPLVSRKKSKR